MRHGSLPPRAATTTLLGFAVLAVLASQVPSPWWSGPLLAIGFELPDAWRTGGAPLISPAPAGDVSAPVVLLPPAAPPGRPRPEPGGADEATLDGSSEAPSMSNRQRRADPAREALLAAMRDLSTRLAPVEVPIENPCLDPDDTRNSAAEPCLRRALDPWFARLERVALHDSPEPARLSQFGDSLVLSDGFTGELRRLLQSQFGDGGHGFLFPDEPERAFGAQDIHLGDSSGWTVRTVVHGSAENPLYGIAGAAFTATREATTGFALTGEGIGATADRLGLLYFARSESGGLALRTDGVLRGEEWTATPGQSAVHWMALPDGTRDVRLSAFRGNAIYFGLLVERSGPGVVVDNLGLVSAHADSLTDVGAEHWRDQIALRGADLLSFFYGVNDVHGESLPAPERYAEQYGAVVGRVRAYMPERACVVISVLTRGEWIDGEVRTLGSVSDVAEAQRRAAIESGCAFWSAWEAAGGPTSAGDWYRSRPSLLGDDLSHPTRAGYRELARLFYSAMIEAFAEYLATGGTDAP